MYVNIKKFSPIRRISKIEYWNNLNPDEDILRTKRVFEGEKEEEEKKYLKMMSGVAKMRFRSLLTAISQRSIKFYKLKKPN